MLSQMLHTLSISALECHATAVFNIVHGSVIKIGKVQCTHTVLVVVYTTLYEVLAAGMLIIVRFSNWFAETGRSINGLFGLNNLGNNSDYHHFKRPLSVYTL